MDYYAHVNYRPFSILAEGTARWILGHWERKGKAYPLPTQWKAGLCQVLSAVAAPSTRVVCFCTSSVVPCSPFGPGLSFKLREHRPSAGGWPGGAVEPRPPRHSPEPGAHSSPHLLASSCSAPCPAPPLEPRKASASPFASSWPPNSTLVRIQQHVLPLIAALEIKHPVE